VREGRIPQRDSRVDWTTQVTDRIGHDANSEDRGRGEARFPSHRRSSTDLRSISSTRDTSGQRGSLFQAGEGASSNGREIIPVSYFATFIVEI